VARARVLILLLFVGCGSKAREQALAEIEAAREELARLAPLAKKGFAHDAVRLARESLLDAESEVRRTRVWPFDSTPAWQPRLDRGVDNARIAAWVVERQQTVAKEEASSWIDSAADSLRIARRTGLHQVHFSVEANLRRAEVTLEEARRLFDAGEFEAATERAGEAAGLAGELPPETKALFARLHDPENRKMWGDWAKAGIAESRRTGKSMLLVDKRAQLAVLWSRGKPVRWFDVELGYNGLERKLKQGDGATPEGAYRVVRKKGRGETKYYKALLLDYPNAEDKRRFREAKRNGEVHQDTSIGNLIEVHGDGGRGTNWTDGCVAVTNEEMDYLFEKLSVGSSVVIVGNYVSLPEPPENGN
jgi:hypothetical protein